MARQFLSPEEARLLRDLVDKEAKVISELFELLDAHLVEVEDVAWMKKPTTKEARQVAA
jgi:predicted transcriptional regulator